MVVGASACGEVFFHQGCRVFGCEEYGGGNGLGGLQVLNALDAGIHAAFINKAVAQGGLQAGAAHACGGNVGGLFVRCGAHLTVVKAVDCSRVGSCDGVDDAAAAGYLACVVAVLHSIVAVA